MLRAREPLPAETSEASTTDHASTAGQAFAATLERTGPNDRLPNDGAGSNALPNETHSAFTNAAAGAIENTASLWRYTSPATH